jgi:hypothetical protein
MPMTAEQHYWGDLIEAGRPEPKLPKETQEFHDFLLAERGHTYMDAARISLETVAANGLPFGDCTVEDLQELATFARYCEGDDVGVILATWSPRGDAPSELLTLFHEWKERTQHPGTLTLQ